MTGVVLGGVHHFAAITGSEVGLIITAFAGLITAIAGAFAIFKKPSNQDKGAQKAATAVSTIVQTKEQVDALVGIVTDLQTQLTKLKALREVDRRQIQKLKNELEKEKGRHKETRRLLEEAQAELLKKDSLIADLQTQLDKLNAK